MPKSTVSAMVDLAIPKDFEVSLIVNSVTRTHS